MSEHSITKRFRAWLESVADVITCDVIDPKNLKRRCGLSFGHEGKHDFDAEALLSQEPIRKTGSLGSWSKRRGHWYIKIVGDDLQTGDIVPVRSSDGVIQYVLLGVRVGREFFVWAGNVDGSSLVVDGG